jgi:hypothetical protein
MKWWPNSANLPIWAQIGPDTLTALARTRTPRTEISKSPSRSAAQWFYSPNGKASSAGR